MAAVGFPFAVPSGSIVTACFNTTNVMDNLRLYRAPEVAVIQTTTGGHPESSPADYLDHILSDELAIIAPPSVDLEEEDPSDNDEDWDTVPLTTAEIDALCASPDFALTPENFVLSSTTAFLKAYTLAHSSSPAFRFGGVLGSLASTHLGEPNLSCGVNTPHRCAPSCTSVVRKLQGNLLEARAVYFTFVSAQHLAETLRSLSNGLQSAQLNVGQMSGEFAHNFFGGTTKDGDFIKYAIKLSEFILSRAIGFIAPGFQPEIVAAIIPHKYDEAKMEAERFGATLARFQAEMRNNIRMGRAKKAEKDRIKINGVENLLQLAMQRKQLLWDTYLTVKSTFGLNSETPYSTLANGGVVASMGAMTLVGYWKDKIEGGFASAGSDRGYSWDKNSMESFISITTSMARQAVLDLAEEIFLGNGVFSDGSGRTMFSDIVAAGNFLPGDSNSDVAYYHSAGLEQTIQRSVMLKALNQAFRSQRIYITCTRDFRITSKPHRPSSESYRHMTKAANCRRDNTGPQDFKACIDDMVCYMYRFNDRATQTEWHNERPKGKEVWEEHPWNIDIRDVIESSVRGYQDGSREDSGLLNSITNPDTTPQLSREGIEKSVDPKTPGLFTIPVCFSTYGWSTVVDGHKWPMSWVHNLDMSNSIKSLPCNCGPWGRDTEAVWRDLGLWGNHGKARAMKCINCGWQIHDKIRDILERYVAFCRLGVRELPVKHAPLRVGTPHVHCQQVTELVDRHFLDVGVVQLKRSHRPVYDAVLCFVFEGLKEITGDACAPYNGLTLKERVLKARKMEEGIGAREFEEVMGRMKGGGFGEGGK